MYRKTKKGYDIQFSLNYITITFDNEREPKLMKLYKKLKQYQIENPNFDFTLKGNFVSFTSTEDFYLNLVLDLLVECEFSPQTHCVFCEEKTYEEIQVNGKYFRAHFSCFEK